MSVEKLKKSQSAYSGAITPIRNRFCLIAEDEPSTYDLGQLERQLASIDHTSSSYKQVQSEICAEGADFPNLEEEQEVSDAFCESVERTYSLLHHLIALKQVQQAAANLDYDLEDLETAKSTNPERDHTATLTLLTS